MMFLTRLCLMDYFKSTQLDLKGHCVVSLNDRHSFSSHCLTWTVMKRVAYDNRKYRDNALCFVYLFNYKDIFTVGIYTIIAE